MAASRLFSVLLAHVRRRIRLSSRVMVILVGLMGAGLPMTTANAQSYDVDQNSFFTLPPGDRSSELLMVLFGDSWRTITRTTEVPYISHTAAGISNDSNPGGVMGAMSKVLNTACLMITLFIVFTSTVTGIMISAHKGVPFGEKYSTLWMPLRSILSITALAPILGGYSLVQGLIFYITKISIGIANVAFSGVLSFMTAGYGIGMPRVDHGTELASALLRSNACMYFMNHAESDDVPRMDRISMQTAANVESTANDDYANNPYSFDSIASSNQSVQLVTLTSAMSFDGTPASGMTQGVCGTYRMEFRLNNAETGVGASINAAQRNYANAVWSAFQQLNSSIASVGAVLGNPNYAGEAVSSRALYDATQNYQNAVRSAAAAYKSAVTASTGQGSAVVASTRSAIEKSGWIMMGSYYWSMQRTLNRVEDILSTHPIVNGQAQDGIDGGKMGLMDVDLATDYAQTAGYRVKNYIAEYAVKSVNEEIPDNTAIQNSLQDQTETPIRAKFFELAARPLVNRAIKMMTDDSGDAIGNFASLGHMLVLTSEGWFLANGIVGAINAATGSKVSGFIGAIYNSASGTNDKTQGWSFLDSLMGILFIAGAFLAFWLPSIPLILWVAGTTGWLINALLATISAPIWAAGHAAPEGDGWVSQYAKTGYMLVLSLLLRPTMMVFGMIGGMLIMQAVGLLIGAFAPIAFSSLTAGSIAGVASIIAFLGIITVIVISTANRCFELCFEAGDQILKFIGGGLESLGDTKVLQGAQGAYQNITGSLSELKRTSNRATRSPFSQIGKSNTVVPKNKDMST